MCIPPPPTIPSPSIESALCLAHHKRALHLDRNQQIQQYSSSAKSIRTAQGFRSCCSALTSCFIHLQSPRTDAFVCQDDYTCSAAEKSPPLLDAFNLRVGIKI